MIIRYNKVDILRKELVVLKNVSLQIKRGELVYLIGRVGSGKSSLMKTIYAEVPVSCNEADSQAEVLEYNLCKLKRKQIPYLRRQIGIVFQDFQLLTDRSVKANLDFVLRATGWKDKSAREERIESVLRQVGMTNKSYKMPHELSGGEQQRIAIARAMLNDPALILADEPTGNLDPETGEQIMAGLYELAMSGKAVVVATHNMALMKRFPGIVYRCEDKALIREEDEYVSSSPALTGENAGFSIDEKD